MTESLFSREILSGTFDSPESAPRERLKKVFICTTPRTAGHTLCHALRHRGWGAPSEYFHPDMVLPLQRRWLDAPPADWAAAQGRVREYGDQLLSRRSPNGIFAAKLFRADVPFASEAVGLNDAAFIHLLRDDLVAQTISTAAMISTGRPFDGPYEASHIFRRSEINARFMLELLAWLQRENESWRSFLAERPSAQVVRLSAEQFLASPAATLEWLGRRLVLPEGLGGDDFAGVCAGPYRQDRDLKQQLKEAFGELLVKAVAESRPAKRVEDWATDFDILDPAWRNDPHSIWRDLRQRRPVARTCRHGGVQLPTRYDDIRAIAYDHEHFSSRHVLIGAEPLGRSFPFPPLTSDPPEHRHHRQNLLPWLSRQRVDGLESVARDMCRALIAEIGRAHSPDAVAGYARALPLEMLFRDLDIPVDDRAQLAHWADVFSPSGQTTAIQTTEAASAMEAYFRPMIIDRVHNPRDDLISLLVSTRRAGRPLTINLIQASIRTYVSAAVDTVSSVIASSLLHLADHPEHRRRLASEPELIETAVDEFLRMFGPAAMARFVVKPTEISGHRFEAGSMVLLPFAAANRDPEIFEDPENVILDRQGNHRHLSFGAGVHRCPGAFAGRMMIKTALLEWLTAFPEFSAITDPPPHWSDGAVRALKSLPVKLPESLVTAPDVAAPLRTMGRQQEVKETLVRRPMRFGRHTADLFLRVWGPNGKAVRGTLICLHGFADNGMDFRFLAHEAAVQGYRVVAPDLPGRGLSSWLPKELYGLRTFLMCIPPALELARGPASIVTSSWGGFLAVPYLASPKAPRISKLVMVDPVLSGGEALNDMIARIDHYAGRTFADIPEMMEHMVRSLGSAYLLKPDALERFARERAIWVDGKLILAYDPALAGTSQSLPQGPTAITKLLPNVKARVLLIFGAQSAFRDRQVIDQLKRDLPDLTTIEDYPGAHPPLLLDRAQTDPILSFLKT